MSLDARSLPFQLNRRDTDSGCRQSDPFFGRVVRGAEGVSARRVDGVLMHLAIEHPVAEKSRKNRLGAVAASMSVSSLRI